MRNPQPTPEAYAELQAAFEHFNKELFGGAIPNCLITIPATRRSYGYFCAARFSDRGGTHSDEIAMNPAYFATRTIRETLSTLVHEMCHAWEFHLGKPGRRGYHNVPFSKTMERVGLMTSSTGKPGGKRVGERMSHYIIDGGAFDVACEALLSRSFQLSWVYRFGTIEPPTDPGGEDEGAEGPAAPNRSNRVKYRCPGCGVQVWGKPGLALLCGQDQCAGCAFEPSG